MWDVDVLCSTLLLLVLFFDCLRIDARDLVGEPARERFDALAAALPGSLLTPRLIAADVAAAQAFYDDAVARGHEGVMVKSLDAAY